MKIVIDARVVYTSTGRYVERLLHYLQELDHDNEYHVLLKKADMERWRPTAPNFHPVEADFTQYSFAEQIGLNRLLTRLKPDLVHFTMPQQPVLYRGAKITTVHDLTLINFINKRKTSLPSYLYKYVLKPLIFKFVMWRVVTTSKIVITPTKFVKQQIVDRYRIPESRITVTYEAADDVASAAAPCDEMVDKDFILYVGNAMPYKNLPFLVESFARLSERQPKLHLALAGKFDYYYPELQRMIDERGIERVHLLGFVPDAQLKWLYQHTLLYVFPSLSEGFGLPPLEAMVQKVPVLSSNASCLPEVYGEAADYFDPQNQTELADKIDELMKNPAKRSELSKRGETLVASYSWRRMAEQTLAEYRTLGR